VEDKTKWLKNHLKDNTKTEHWKWKIWASARELLQDCMKSGGKNNVVTKKTERPLKLLTEFLSKTLKTKAANFEGSPKGKNCWYIFWNSYKRHTCRQIKYEKNSWVRKMLYRATVCARFVDFSESMMCMGCFRAVESWGPLPI